MGGETGPLFETEAGKIAHFFGLSFFFFCPAAFEEFIGGDVDVGRNCHASLGCQRGLVEARRLTITAVPRILEGEVQREGGGGEGGGGGGKRAGRKIRTFQEIHDRSEVQLQRN